ncbi:MAG: putative Mg(2+) transport ATPase [Firmicutes bacterium ADurb.Bin193]|nr:MAG: putative Mg(2+) transport ATPase [Firmicutes bacterium ADurb.Bin193]
MSFDNQYIMSVISLVIAAVLGGIIGFERAGKNHDAGLRTHILVCLGSATVMVLGRYIMNDYDIDIARLGAQVISGIGFLGVGCIIVTGDRVKGLTTAAGLWATACLGLVIGMGYYLVAITVVALMLLAVLGLRPIAMKFQEKAYDMTISVTMSSRGAIADLFSCLSGLGIETASVRINQVPDDDTIRVIAESYSKKAVAKSDLIALISAVEGVKTVVFL